MTIDRDALLHDPRIESAINEFTSLISHHYPGTTFTTYVGDDSGGVFLRAVIDVDDPDEVMNLVIDRLVKVQDEEDVPLYVLPVTTRERAAAVYAREHARFKPANTSVAAIG
jgi:hypothetical protein